MIGRAAFLIALSAAGALFAQDSNAGRLRFEAASIKPDNSGDTPMRVAPLPGGSFHAENVTLRVLLTVAYHVSDYQLSGGPSWIGTDRYDVIAKPAESATLSQSFEMLQALLEDRFRLRVHRETREGTVLDLTVASGGPKLTPAKEGTCVRIDRGAAPPPLRTGEMPPNFCGNFGLARGQINAFGARMDQLAVVLGRLLEHPVIDKTGIGADEIFDVHITHSPDEPSGGNLGPAGGSGPDSSLLTPGISTALQEQLGLKLQTAKGPIDMLVIDNVERASAN